MGRRTAVVILVVLYCSIGLLIGGCSKVTDENYAKIETGMDYDEVIAILGPPDEVKDAVGTKSAVWGKGSRTISIKFVADKVVYRSAKGLD